MLTTAPRERLISELKGGVQCIDCGAFQEEGDQAPIYCRCGTVYVAAKTTEATAPVGKQ